MCFEIIELRDLKCVLFQAFLAKLSWENGLRILMMLPEDLKDSPFFTNKKHT